MKNAKVPMQNDFEPNDEEEKTVKEKDRLHGADQTNLTTESPMVEDSDDFHACIGEASRGYGLDKHIMDPRKLVGMEALQYLLEHDVTLSEWIEANPDKCALAENRAGIKAGIRAEGATTPEQDMAACRMAAQARPNQGAASFTRTR